MYYNRELSWILFNKRILNESKDNDVLLFERLKFLSITASNLDEFFMVRVASIKDLFNAGYKKPDMSGMDPVSQLTNISKETHKLVKDQYLTHKVILEELSKNGLDILSNEKNLDKKDEKFIDDYFSEKVFPVLTPVFINKGKPFPLIKNKSLNIVVKLKKKNNFYFATVRVPDVISRLVQLPEKDKDSKRIILLENIIKRNIKTLFRSYDIVDSSFYRITRNAGMTIDEDDASDLLNGIKKELKKREWGEVIRLEVNKDIDKSLLKFLKQKFGINKNGIFEIDGPIDLTYLMDIYSLDNFDNLKNKQNESKVVKEFENDSNIFKRIDDKDIILNHPYHSYNPVIEFVEQASEDPNVLAIKQTLYRVSKNSPIVSALMTAAKNGKQVTVLVELKARFDEENNIEWAEKLEKAGCHVIYGIPGLKIHSKICLVVKKNSKGDIKRYVHLGTGNYNERTAKIYTDISYFTSSKEIGEDATTVFNLLSGNSKPQKWNKLIVAPHDLKKEFVKLINREKENVSKGHKGYIIAKMNSLCDKDIIDALYDASKSGVKIDLIVRGICSLKVGIKDISENITVRSIVGNQLEHSRIYYFYNNGKEEIFCSSADWMPRNLERRVEILFPILDEKCKSNLIDLLQKYLKDNMKAHIMKSSGKYEKEKPTDKNKYLVQDDLWVSTW